MFQHRENDRPHVGLDQPSPKSRRQTRGKRGERRMLTCFHEAGHCLVRWYFGHYLDRVLVLTVEEVRAGIKPLNRRGRPVPCEGLVDAYDIGELNLTPDMVAKHPEFARHIMIRNEIALVEANAGVDAEAQYAKRSALTYAMFGGRGDMDNLRQLLDTWWPRKEDQKSVDLLAEQRSRALLRSRDGWAAVTAIANALKLRGELSGDEVAALCRTAYGGREARHGAWHEHWPPTLEMLRSGFVPDSRYVDG